MKLINSTTMEIRLKVIYCQRFCLQYSYLEYSTSSTQYTLSNRYKLYTPYIHLKTSKKMKLISDCSLSAR